MLVHFQAVVLEENATVLSGKEVRIEWRIEFRLDLPDRKSLTVKSKPSHTLGAVLGPILTKHGYNLQLVTLCLVSKFYHYRRILPLALLRRSFCIIEPLMHVL